jgi:outer membrane lipoprotein carrier protein
MKKYFLILFVAFALMLQYTSSYAGLGKERLQKFFDNVKTIEADFTQTVLDAQLNTIQSSAGTMKLERPGKFRWDYSKPYVQEIVGDGHKVWLYDKDLEQVTVKKMDEALGNTPAILLAGNEPLEKNFFINELGHDLDKNKDREWVELLPKETNSGFERMVLIFDKDGLKAMELRDSLGQHTRLQFDNIKTNITFNEAVFNFVPPKGVDVIGDVASQPE